MKFHPKLVYIENSRVWSCLLLVPITATDSDWFVKQFACVAIDQ